MTSEVERIRRRFEIAVLNFATSAFNLQANEKAFQAWYAAQVIQEFGVSRVYREIHLSKRQLASRVISEQWADVLSSGNELFPDLSVSWEPAIDARHTAARPEELDARTMLLQFSVVSEFKATGSTKWSTSPNSLRMDIRKLGIFSEVAGASGVPTALSRSPSFYMVILDNHMREGRPLGRAGPEWMGRLLDRTWFDWPPEVARPTVLVARAQGSSVILDAYDGDSIPRSRREELDV